MFRNLHITVSLHKTVKLYCSRITYLAHTLNLFLTFISCNKKCSKSKRHKIYFVMFIFPAVSNMRRGNEQTRNQNTISNPTTQSVL